MKDIENTQREDLTLSMDLRLLLSNVAIAINP
jgi:hypothetical protein